MFRAASRHERICWRPWPCPKCCGGITPISHLFSRLSTGAIFPRSTPEEIAAVQTAQLQEWASSCVHEWQSEIFLPKLAEESEHLVFLDSEKALVYKVTRPGIFGESYYLVDGVVHQRNCSPLDYLLRLRFWKKVFGSSPKDFGITNLGQIVSVHEFISGTAPTQEEVDGFLDRSGFKPVRRNCWLWKSTFDEFEIWVGDARRDNFVKTTTEIVPIDLRIWFEDRS